MHSVLLPDDLFLLKSVCLEAKEIKHPFFGPVPIPEA